MHKKEDLGFQDKKLKEKEYYYNLNKRKSGKIFVINKLP